MPLPSQKLIQVHQYLSDIAKISAFLAFISEDTVGGQMCANLQ